MASTANGPADTHPPYCEPVNHDPNAGEIRSDLFRRLNSGGIGRPSHVASPPLYSEDIKLRYEKQYLPGQTKSLSGIAMRAFLLGFVLSACAIFTGAILVLSNSPLWRLTFYITVLSTFHFLEFWTTARYNTREAQISSFLLSENGSAYPIAHAAAFLECAVRNVLFPTTHWFPESLNLAIIVVGLGMTLVGQSVRSGAMIQAGTNFNHTIQYYKSKEHQLVTDGLYHYFRHPSYFGFFWWGLGTQLVLGNFICFFAYAFILWKFFSSRISGEEELLVAFFGERYETFRRDTRVWIPFIK